MNNTAQQLKTYTDTHPIPSDNTDCDTILDHLFLAYQDVCCSDPPEIQAGFADLDSFLSSLSSTDNNAVFHLVCKLCLAYERKAFLIGIQYGAHLMQELFSPQNTPLSA